MSPLNFAVIHLDLGQGGAERQTIDEAIALKSNGHRVTIYTSHHDRTRCFQETVDPKILGNDIQVYGDWIPRHIFGKLHALMSIYRMLWCSLRVLWSNESYDIVFVDQVSAIIPVLRLKGSHKIVYYCHHPDMLLVQNKANASTLKRVYRHAMDWFECTSTVCCDALLVNSEYTKSVVLATFPILKQMPFLQPMVVYPAIDTSSINESEAHDVQNKRVTFLSINRYERKKQIDLAIKALHELFATAKAQGKGNHAGHIKLIIAGGFDDRVLENKQYLDELIAFCAKMQLKYQFLDTQQLNDDDDGVLILDNKCVDSSATVYFMTKFPDRLKRALFKECSAVLYTPEYEHFGIVPIEAMLAMRPPIACNNGGPLETIVQGETGFLCESDPKQWAKTMQQFVEDRQLTLRLGRQGRQRVLAKFSRQQLQNVMQEVVRDVRDKKLILPMGIKLQAWFILFVLLWTFINCLPVLVAISKLSLRI